MQKFRKIGFFRIVLLISNFEVKIYNKININKTIVINFILDDLNKKNLKFVDKYPFKNVTFFIITL